MNPQLQKIQKDSGIKMGKYDNKQNELYHRGKLLLQMVDLYIKSVEEANMTDYPFYLDFEDKLNEYSVKDHNASPE